MPIADERVTFYKKRSRNGPRVELMLCAGSSLDNSLSTLQPPNQRRLLGTWAHGRSPLRYRPGFAIATSNQFTPTDPRDGVAHLVNAAVLIRLLVFDVDCGYQIIG